MEGKPDTQEVGAAHNLGTFPDATAHTDLHAQNEQRADFVRDVSNEGRVLEEHEPEFADYRHKVNGLREALGGLSPDDPEQREAHARHTRELAEAQKNYPGDWTLLELRRVLNSASQEKMRALVAAHEPLFKTGNPTMVDKERSFASYYTPYLDADMYTKRVADVFLQTGTVPAGAYEGGYYTPEQLGVGKSGESGTVFADAASGGKALTPRQKNIIEAHEKAHGLFSFNDSPMGATLRNVLDRDVLETQERTTYQLKPDEIHARMSQLRNYFGLDAQEMFTKEHLAVARERYLEDTRLDNNMRTFLACVTPRTEDAFVEAMNTFPM